MLKSSELSSNLTVLKIIVVQLMLKTTKKVLPPNPMIATPFSLDPQETGTIGKLLVVSVLVGLVLPFLPLELMRKNSTYGHKEP